VQLLGKAPTADGNEDRITFDLTAIPADVERIVVAASRYEGAGFQDLHDVRLTLADGSGEPLLGFSVEDAGRVGALLFGELYRRGADWKFRAIGQGYESGLAGLATDFGVDIDDTAEPEDAPAPEAVVAVVEAGAPIMAVTVPAQPASGPADGAKKRASRPRTAKKKVTLPKVAKKSLADKGNAESGFIRSVDESVDRFHAQVVVHLDSRTPRARQPAEAAVAG
jgi:hypothetical protein